MILPFMYFSTDIIILDDDQDFLEELKYLLISNGMRPKLVSNPTDIFPMRENFENTRKELLKLINKSEEERYERYSTEFRLDQIIKLKDSPKKNEIVSTIIVDYDMPDINGLEVCRALSKTPIKRILLTGAADEDIAVEAFNNGIIDQYVKKQSLNMHQEIIQSIKRMTNAFFKEISDTLSAFIESSGALHDSEFCKYFNEICRNRKINEYYSLSANGSYVLIDHKGNERWLVVFSEQELEGLLECLEDEGADVRIIENLKQKNDIIFYYNQGFKIPPLKELDKHSYPITRLNGENGKRFYVAHIENPNFIT